MKIFLVAGHGGADTGAIYFEKKESFLTMDFVKSLSSYLSKYTLDIDKGIKDGFTLSEKINYISKNSKNEDIAIEFHFNASENNTASGCEVFISENTTEKEIELSSKLCYFISSCLGIKNRGVKKPLESKRGKLAFLDLKCNSILVEICFMSNKSDMEKYEKNKEFLIKKIINIF